MQIRRFEPEDAREVSALIIKTLRETSIRDYSREYIEDLVTRMGPEDILKKAQETHYYVFCDEGRIAGCGAIGPYEGKTEESVLSSVFVLPEYQGTGWEGRLCRRWKKTHIFFGQKGLKFQPLLQP